MNRPRRGFIAALCVAAVCVAAAAAAGAADALRGSGRVVVQPRDVGDFNGVALGGPFELVLVPGQRAAVQVLADDNVLPLVETTVETAADGRRSLHVDLQRGARLADGTRVVVTVAVARLDAIALGGSGRIAGSGLRSDALTVAVGGSGAIRLAALEAARLDVSVGGSGSFEADGQAGRLQVGIGGTGRVAAGRLVARDVRASVAGSGSARLHADATLDVSIAGSGEVVYSGNARPHVAVAGSGRARRAA